MPEYFIAYSAILILAIALIKNPLAANDTAVNINRPSLGSAKKAFNDFHNENNQSVMGDNKKILVNIDGTEYKIRTVYWGDGIPYEKHGRFTEMINTNSDKVLFRRGRYTNNLNSSFCDWYYLDQEYKENLGKEAPNEPDNPTP